MNHYCYKTDNNLFLFNYLILIIMNEKLQQRAIDLFILRVGVTPKECGYQVIDIYEKQKAFIYAPDNNVIKNYKSSQSIIRWIMAWGFIPLLLAFSVVFFYGFPHFEKTMIFWDPITIGATAFFILWSILIFILCNIALIRNKRVDNKVYWINYK